MLSKRSKRTEKMLFAAEPELRAEIEAEAIRRDTSMSSTIRNLIRCALASQSSKANMQGAAR